MEKLANHIALQSITEGGMEKQALNVAQLLRMGRNFALRGKIDRFNKLMDRRAQAASRVSSYRENALSDAFHAFDRTQGYLFDGEVNPVLGKMLSAEKRRLSDPVKIISNPNPHARAAVTVDARNDLADLLNLPAAERNFLLNATPTYNSDQLSTFRRSLNQLDPELHKKVLTTGSF